MQINIMLTRRWNVSAVASPTLLLIGLQWFAPRQSRVTKARWVLVIGLPFLAVTVQRLNEGAVTRAKPETDIITAQS